MANTAPLPSKYPLIKWAGQTWLLGQRAGSYWLCLAGHDWSKPENWIPAEGDAVEAAEMSLVLLR